MVTSSPLSGLPLSLKRGRAEKPCVPGAGNLLSWNSTSFISCVALGKLHQICASASLLIEWK